MESDQSSLEEGYSSEEENSQVLIQSKKPSGRDFFGENASDDDTDEEAVDRASGKASNPNAVTYDQDTDSNHTPQNQERNLDIAKEKFDEQELKLQKLQNLKKLRVATKTNHKTGVVYLSKIPPYMKPAKMRQILSRFGVVDRLFLKREEEQKFRNRVRGGGNKKTMFEEGWVEFIRKKDAKLCASTLNGNTIGGKKGNFYHDDIINVKYLPGFKWADLTEQIAKENDVRQAKLQLEISQANKLNAEFIRNVERSKMINKVKSKRKRQDSSNKDANIERTFTQRKVTTNRAAGQDHQKQQTSKGLDTVIHSLF